MKEVTAGHDELTLFIFKNNFDIIGDVLQQIFALSLSTGVVPASMKIAKATCVYKAGDH